MLRSIVSVHCSNTPIILASASGSASVVQHLLKKNADVDAVNIDGVSWDISLTYNGTCSKPSQGTLHLILHT
jgi:hypothetical protein